MKARMNSNKGMISTVFVLMLFLLFAITALLLALFGAEVYENTASDAEENSQLRASLLYVSNKLHGGDTAAGCGLLTYNEEMPVLCIAEEFGGEYYITYIYHYDGALREQFLHSGMTFDPAYGEAITELTDFIMEPRDSNRLRLTAVYGEESRTVTVALRTGGAA